MSPGPVETRRDTIYDPAMRHWRKMTWVIWMWVVLTILFIVLVNTVNPEPCNEQDSASQAGCEIGQDIAPGVWTAVGLVVGFMGFIVLALIWFMTRPKQGKVQVVYVQTPPGSPLPPPPPPS